MAKEYVYANVLGRTMLCERVKLKAVKLSPKQHELLLLVADGSGIKGYNCPGREHEPTGYYLLKAGDHRDLDGRTVRGLDLRKLIEYDGDGTYVISAAGKAAITPEQN